MGVGSDLLLHVVLDHLLEDVAKCEAIDQIEETTTYKTVNLLLKVRSEIK